MYTYATMTPRNRSYYAYLKNDTSGGGYSRTQKLNIYNGRDLGYGSLQYESKTGKGYGSGNNYFSRDGTGRG